MTNANTAANGEKVATFDLEAFQVRMMEICDEMGVEYESEAEACHKVAAADADLFSTIRAKLGFKVEVPEVKLTVNEKTGTMVCPSEQ